MEEPLPIGMGLRVPPPTPLPTQSLDQRRNYNIAPDTLGSAPEPSKVIVESDGLCEFDKLGISMVCRLC